MTLPAEESELVRKAIEDAVSKHLSGALDKIMIDISGRPKAESKERARNAISNALAARRYLLGTLDE
jgi:hypothetical protein